MKDVAKMKRERGEVAKQLRTLTDAVESRDKVFTPDEETRFNELVASIDKADADVKREEQLQAIEARNTPAAPAAKGPNEFRAFGEFLQAVAFDQNNSALRTRTVGGIEDRTLSVSVPTAGGFVVPDEWDTSIRMVEPNEAIFRPRSTVIPSGTMPDAAVNIVSLDQSAARGVYSGVTVQWINEMAARQNATDPALRTVRLEPREVSGFIDVSDKLMRNSAAIGALVEKLLRKAIIGSEEATFFAGTGVAQPLGILGHPSTINIIRAGANAVAYNDIVGMYARAKFGGRLVWIGNQTVLPQLMRMVDVGNNLIWQPNAREGAPGTLLGIPFILNDQSPVLGTQGDLALVDLDYYLIKDGSPLAILINPYLLQTNGLTRITAFWNVDGQPWLTTPMLQRDGVSTVSPFVVLQ